VSGTPTFGGVLKAARSRKSLTQEELAERAGLSVRGVRYLEQELRRPYPDTVQRLAEALGLSDVERGELAAAARPGAPDRVTASAVPAAPGPLIGRETEAETVAQLLLQHDVRVLTLTGPGGVGKTRLAMEAAVHVQPHFPGGVIWVPLVSLAESTLVPRAIGKGLGLMDAGVAPLEERLVLALRDRPPVLLLLDNFEHVTAAAGIVGDIVAACPRAKVLVTSRAALLLRSERELPDLPLKLPVPTAPLSVYTLAANPCVDLFLRRAQAVKPEFALTADNAPAVAAICHRLEGLPLALELAAVRVRALAPKAMLQRLEHRLSFLTSAAPDLPARQRTMKETIAWSHDLLGPVEQTLLRRLAVFAGGWDLEALEAVCGAAGDGSLDALAAVEALQRCSLVHSHETADGELRFTMLETVREYALEKLSVSKEEQAVRARHAAWFRAVAEEGAPRFFSPAQGRWLDTLEREHDNLRAALRWCIERKDAETGLRLAAAVWTLWYVRGYAEGRAFLAALLALPWSSAIQAPRAAALHGAGQIALWWGDGPAARALLEESIALRRTLGDERGMAHALLSAGFNARLEQRYDDAGLLLEEALALARKIGERFITAASLHHMGLMAVDVRGDVTTGRSLFEESLSVYRTLGLPHFIGVVSVSLGDLARAEGDHARAGALLRDALATIAANGERPSIPFTLDCLAHLAMDAGSAARAVRLSGAASRLREASGVPSFPVATQSRERWLKTARGELGEDTFAVEWAAGRAMSQDQAIADALRVPA
jgi:predicted ATPase